LIVTIFRTRFKAGNEAEYYEWSARMSALAEAMPGFISRKSFTAEDGERVTIIEFEDEESQAAWRGHPEHRKAQALGREKFYAEYDLKVCELKRSSHHKA
jgi:heme-degrading monooxygenase HmoA